MQKHGWNRNTTCIPNQEIENLLKAIHIWRTLFSSMPEINVAAIIYPDIFPVFSTILCSSVGVHPHNLRGCAWQKVPVKCFKICHTFDIRKPT